MTRQSYASLVLAAVVAMVIPSAFVLAQTAKPAAPKIINRYFGNTTAAVAALQDTADLIEATGEASGGEVEFVLLQHAGKLWVGTGSDHTDREVEKYGVTVSKQMCEKPIAPVFWAYDDVAPHWDRLVLRAHVVEGGKRARPVLRATAAGGSSPPSNNWIGCPGMMVEMACLYTSWE